MNSVKPPKETISLFPSFADLPDPPVEEIVEPKSFRNTMIRTLLWMAIIPAFALFFLLHQQIQSATKNADNVQLSIAQNIAITSSNVITNTEKMVRLSKDLLGSQDHDTKELNQMLVSLSKQQPNLTYLGWYNENHEPMAVYVPEDINAFTKVRSLLPSIRFGQNKTYISRMSDDSHELLIAFETKSSFEHTHYFVGLMRLDSIIHLMDSITAEQHFTVSLLEGEERVIYSSPAESTQDLVTVNDREWETIRKNPKGSVIRSAGTRDVALVRSFVYLPQLDWTIIVSESLQQRDALVRSSTITAFIVLLVTFAVSIIAGVFIAAPMNRSVNLLSEAVSRFGRTGQFDKSLSSDLEKEGTTELVALGHSFERMAFNIQDSNAKLARMNAELEQMVFDRTALILVRNKELRALHRLLVPIQSNELSESEIIGQSLEEFRSLLGLTELKYISLSDDSEIDVSHKPKQRIPVSMNSRQFGWLEVGENDVITADRLESLQRLSNSLSILLGNKNLVTRLEKEHATLASVFASMTDGIVIVGRSGRVIYANKLAAKMLNNSQPIMGQDAHCLLTNRWKPSNTTQVFDLDTIGETIRMVPIDVKNEAKHSTLDIVTFKVSDLPGFSGERTGLLIREMSREAEIESMKDNLMSVVAHELKTPVTAVRLQAESLRHSSLSNQVANLDDIEEMIEESARLGQLIDDLLDVSRIEGGAMKLAPKVVQVASLIDRATRLTLSRFPIRIERTIDPDAETFLADPDRITQVFINLFNNAARYKKPSQEVALCNVKVDPLDEYVRIEITDFGRGIPDSIIGSIFDRFYQANMTDLRVSGGTGLGLSIVRGIVEAHGGTITVESVLEEYTRFTILLPY